MKNASLIACLVSATVIPAVAQKIDKTKILEAMRRDCPAQTLPDKNLVDALLIGDGNLAAFCECLAVRFSSQIDDTDSGNETTIDAKLADSKRFCLAISMKVR
jgi:hypothetical protein